MKQIALFFNIFTVVFFFACRPAAKLATPSVEMMQTATSFPKTDTLLQGLLERYPQFFDTLLRKKDAFGIQIIYTKIDRNAANEPSFTHYYYNVDPARYFYPASTVKMPVALLALQRLHELKVAGLHSNTTMITTAETAGQTAAYNDPNSPDGRPTIANYVKKIFLVSDNDAFNRLYEFLGQEYINKSLHRMGYDSVQILHRLQISLNEEQNRRTNPVQFYDTAGHLVYAQAAQRSGLTHQSRSTFLGRGYMSRGQVVAQPFDFSKKNRLSLGDLHSILCSVMFPGSVSKKQRFNLMADDYNLVYRYMSMKPQESRFPQYDTSYSDAYSKFLLYGGRGQMEPGVRIFNKEGDAYGFLTDAAYVADFDKGIEFLLSATIYCNSDGIFNDDKYDYET
ncbi:MAG: hypothetical protein JWP88_1272, partial [Flaviaesturariibacter sp.]|nr:hypothetical protein [Flaviaesturariibacter sp.]